SRAARWKSSPERLAERSTTRLAPGVRAMKRHFRIVTLAGLAVVLVFAGSVPAPPPPASKPPASRPPVSQPPAGPKPVSPGRPPISPAGRTRRTFETHVHTNPHQALHGLRHPSTGLSPQERQLLARRAVLALIV